MCLAILAGKGLIGSCSAAPIDEVSPGRVDAQTLNRKLVMGYQGWFSCPEHEPGGEWRHWFSGKHPTVDLLPDIAELPSDALCPTDLVAADGSKVQLYSSATPAVIETHFRWMEKYGLDGIALQRFATILFRPEQVDRADRILASVQKSAEKHGRIFFVMYDLSGMQAEKLSAVLGDWVHLQSMGVTGSKAYLHHRGHPLLGVWGLGFAGRPLQPQDAKALLLGLRDASAVRGGVTVLGGVPAGWRTGTRDATPGWTDIWPLLGVVSPWTVGRYNDKASMDAYRREFTAPDMTETRRIGVDYMPVIFPGFSWTHSMHARPGASSAAQLNEIPRNCGRFYWQQFASAMHMGVSMVYGAMFDEVDEGTAMYKVVSSAKHVPGTGTVLGESFLTLDADGCNLPSDWYLRLAGAATHDLKAKHIPSLDLPFPPR